MISNTTLATTGPTACSDRFNKINSDLSNSGRGICVYFVKDSNQDPNNAYFSQAGINFHLDKIKQYQQNDDVIAKVVQSSQEIFQVLGELRILHPNQEITACHICSYGSPVSAEFYKQNGNWLEGLLHTIHELVNQLLQYLNSTPSIMEQSNNYWGAQADQHTLAGNKYAKAGQPAEAGKAYGEAGNEYYKTKQKDIAADLYYLAGDAYRKAEKHDLAEDAYAKAANAYSEAGLHDIAADLYYLAGDAYSEAGLHDIAANLYYLAGDAHNKIGEAYTKEDQYNLAQKAYARAQETYSKAGEAYGKVEKAYEETEQKDLVIEACYKAGNAYTEAGIARTKAEDCLQKEVAKIRDLFQQQFENGLPFSKTASLPKRDICVYFVAYSDHNGVHFSNDKYSLIESQINEYKKYFDVVAKVVSSSQDIFNFVSKLRDSHPKRRIKVCHIMSHGGPYGAELYNENREKHYLSVDSNKEHLSQLCDNSGSLVLAWCNALETTEGDSNSIATQLAQFNPNINVFTPNQAIYGSWVTASKEGVSTVTIGNADGSTGSMRIIHYNPDDPNSLLPKTQ